MELLEIEQMPKSNSSGKLMRFSLTAVAVAFSLAACQTAKPLAPPVLGAHEGGGLLQLCFGEFSQDRAFDVAIREFDPATRQIDRRVSDNQLETTLRYNDTKNVVFVFASHRRDCRFWQFSAPAGQYAITTLGEKFGKTSSGGLESLLGAVIRATAKNDTVVFVNADGRLTEQAPTFEVRAGETVHLGTIVFIGENKTRQHPVLDADGNWDGVTTEIVQDRRLILKYNPAGTGKLDTNAVAGAYEAALPRRALTNLVGQELVIEDFPEIAMPNAN